MTREEVLEQLSAGVPALELRHISKSFGSIRALSDVTFEVLPGQVHSLVGENGAGKSTLGKIASGIHQPDQGEIRVPGWSGQGLSTWEALERGIASIQQEISLVPEMTVLNNVFLGVEVSRGAVVKVGAMEEEYEKVREATGFAIEPGRIVSTLSLADQQKVEIMRALVRDAKVIVFDEPTAALDRNEAQKLQNVVRMLADRGAAIVYISHFLDEVLEVSDVITILRDGAHIRTSPADQEDVGTLVKGMIGRDLDSAFPEKRASGEDRVLEVTDLVVSPDSEPISFHINKGEILGVAGLVGSGRTELAEAIFGVNKAASGEIRVEGLPVSIGSPKDALKHGISMVPESRKDDGLFMNLSVMENMTASNLGHLQRAGLINKRRQRAEAERLISALTINSTPDADVVNLSGGNQQKVLFAKSLMKAPKILIADEPTRGVDIGAKSAIYELLADLAEAGMSILMISSEQEEIIGMSHRTLVMRDGAVVRELKHEELDEDSITRAAFGAQSEEESE